MSPPAIILVKPQLGKNIGKAARAMLNFGLDELRLVAPRDGWPNPDAVPAAAGAEKVLEKARVFATTEEAVSDLNRVFAATVRSRDMAKEVIDAKTFAEKTSAPGQSGVLFGREAAGLSNRDVILSDAILTVPVNPKFGSLNLAVAVGIVAYEWFLGQNQALKPAPSDKPAPATKAELLGLFNQLEGELDEKGYFRPRERKKAMIASLRNLLTAADLSGQQVTTLRGVIKALTRD